MSPKPKVKLIGKLLTKVSTYSLVSGSSEMPYDIQKHLYHRLSGKALADIEVELRNPGLFTRYLNQKLCSFKSSQS